MYILSCRYDMGETMSEHIKLDWYREYPSRKRIWFVQDTKNDLTIYSSYQHAAAHRAYERAKAEAKKIEQTKEAQ